jgi:lipopolysaccharide export system permease protein
MIINRGLTTGTFLYLTMLLLPNFLSIILPIALFTVVVFTYNRLAADRELVILRVAGLSQAAIARPALILAGAVVVAGYALNLYLVPESYRMFRELQWEVRYGYSHILLREGAFNNVSDGVTVYVRERSADGQLVGIMVHDARDKDNEYTWLAERGAMVESDGGSRVIMFNGSRQSVDKKTHQLSILYFDRSTYDMKPNQARGEIRFREARERRLEELLNLEEAEHVSPQDVGKFTVEAHKRLASPLFALGYALVGLACLISGAITRRSQAGRIMLAVILVFGLQGLTLALENFTAKSLGLVPLIYVNAILPILFGYYFMVRRRRGTLAEPPLLTAS